MLLNLVVVIENNYKTSNYIKESFNRNDISRHFPDFFTPPKITIAIKMTLLYQLKQEERELIRIASATELDCTILPIPKETVVPNMRII